MDRITKCNACKRDFVIKKPLIGVIESGDLSVQYILCPFCGEKYQVITTDPEMRELIKKRQSLQKKIAIAHAQRFCEKKIRQYIRDFERIRRTQERLLPALKKRGQEILHSEVSHKDD